MPSVIDSVTNAVLGAKSNTSTQTSQPQSNATLPIPTINDGHEESGSIEIPATRNAMADSTQLMHSLSISPSQRQRRTSRNSFGTSLPIPGPKPRSRSRLSRPGMPAIQPSFDILAAKAQDLSQESVSKAKNMAFAFDIDGVLVHGDRLIPEGQRVLEILNGDNELGIKIPYIFLTNGSGKTEEARCAQLSKILKSPISTDQFIQAHTPMKALKEYYEHVLVVGGEQYRCREVAEKYGFKNISVPNDFLAYDRTIAPYRKFGEWEEASARPRDYSKTPIDAILVFSDSRDYATDYQIMMDLLRAENGLLGTVAKDPVSQRIPIYFSQGDMLCPTEHPIPRLSQGTFRLGFEAMYKAITGVELERVVYGKPELATYHYADEVLESWIEELHGDGTPRPKNIYMIGDNPKSDIVGANMYGWNSCLVQTGVHQGNENDVENPASMGLFKNVLEAVKTCIRKELGQDFKFNFDMENPVLTESAMAQAVDA